MIWSHFEKRGGFEYWIFKLRICKKNIILGKSTTMSCQVFSQKTRRCNCFHPVTITIKTMTNKSPPIKDTCRQSSTMWVICEIILQAHVSKCFTLILTIPAHYRLYKSVLNICWQMNLNCNYKWWQTAQICMIYLGRKQMCLTC